ncbi:MAG TPA: hypothetical protein VH276_17485 [Solirubrobacteraceae bacterium]|jgi:hypothetical protein|nr:hypothetical protein [Solirubrobacteraceae bacterium]
MPTHPSHAEVEGRMRALIDDAGIAPPDEVEHAPTSVVLLWHEHKLAVVVDLDEEGAPISPEA